MESVVPIGRFARITRLSIKALRRYDEIGLLPPAEVDPSSGYRYYRLSQANHAEAIRLLRSLDMPLEEIRSVLEAGDPEIVAKHLAAHRERLEERLAEHRRMLAFLERLIRRKEGVMPYEVTVKEVPPQPVAAVRRHTTLERIGETVGGGFAELMAFLGTRGVQPSGAPLVVYHDEIDQETDGEIEMCVPVAGPLEGEGDVRVIELEGGPTATTVHRGPYNEIGPAYHTLAGWIQEHGHELAGPPREIYLNDPQEVEPADILTEIDWPIR